MKRNKGLRYISIGGCLLLFLILSYYKSVYLQAFKFVKPENIQEVYGINKDSWIMNGVFSLLYMVVTTLNIYVIFRNHIYVKINLGIYLILFVVVGVLILFYVLLESSLSHDAIKLLKDNIILKPTVLILMIVSIKVFNNMKQKTA